MITVESDKASMDIPAPYAGVVKEVKIKVGDKASEGTLIMSMDVSDAASKTSGSTSCSGRCTSCCRSAESSDSGTNQTCARAS